MVEEGGMAMAGFERGRQGSRDVSTDSANGEATYNTANLRGLSVRTGNRKKQIKKQIAAPRLQAPKMSILSQRLTVHGLS